MSRKDLTGYKCRCYKLLLGLLSGFNGKRMRIRPGRKTMPGFRQGFCPESKRKYVFFRDFVIEDLPKGVNDHGVAAMIDIVSVIADAVDTHYVGLVLDGPGLKQGFPGQAAPFRPVGDIEENVVFEGGRGTCSGGGAGRRGFGPGRRGLPAPNGKPEIITNQGQDLPAFD